MLNRIERASRLGFDGSVNFALLLAVVALVLMSGLWRTDAGLLLAQRHVGRWLGGKAEFLKA